MAPEIINPSHDVNGMPVVESKPADVFAFAMFAVEVFTGRMPFEKGRNEAIALRISQGGRPGLPENAQAVGLTDEMWKLIESCWQQDPEERPTMDEVVRRLREFVEHDDDNNNNNNNNNDDVVTECVQIVLTSSSIRFSIFYDQLELGDHNRRPLYSGRCLVFVPGRIVNTEERPRPSNREPSPSFGHDHVQHLHHVGRNGFVDCSDHVVSRVRWEPTCALVFDTCKRCRYVSWSSRVRG